ncbi:MAG: hypothetical protein Q9227_003738 [Pyrenula ochraceoflavens]
MKVSWDSNKDHPALLTAVDSVDHVHLIVGCGPLAAARASRSLEVGARPIIFAPEAAEVHYTLAQKINDGTVKRFDCLLTDNDLTRLGRGEVDNVVDAVYITVNTKSAQTLHISKLCRRLRIPVNVADSSNLCTFTLLSTHSDGPLQIGITTSGHGCRLSSRIRREIASFLPAELGPAIQRLGTIRRRINEEDHAAEVAANGYAEAEEDEVSTNQKHTFNKLIRPSDTDPSVARNRRMRWLSQICEYWPLRRLAEISESDISAILAAYTSSTTDDEPPMSAVQVEKRLQPRGKITLAGSGPGHPDLLTRATYHAIQSADVILADKLVPAPVLDLIPRRTPVHIARKFPGNADAAQEELLKMGLDATKMGKHVLRLKQGDPYLYGRGAEEHAFFEREGFQPIVLPGITSALSAPLFARIPPTHRAVADSVLVCTGTGRKGAMPDPPPYMPTQTLVFLMALHRLEDLVTLLTRSPVPSICTGDDNEVQSHKGTASRLAWPSAIPCAVIERASCPDQRVIRSTLQHVCRAVEEEGSRPPGLLVVGKACQVLWQPEEGGPSWTVDEGFRGLDGTESGLNVIEQMGKEQGTRQR